LTLAEAKPVPDLKLQLDSLIGLPLANSGLKLVAGPAHESFRGLLSRACRQRLTFTFHDLVCWLNAGFCSGRVRLHPLDSRLALT
jgi:hypothetical protein